MSEADTTIPREEQMLGELAELDLALARRVHAKAMAAEDPDEINALCRSYQRLSRSVRQSLIAKAKLARDREATAARRRSLDALDGLGDGLAARLDPRVDPHFDSQVDPGFGRIARPAMDPAARDARIGESFAAVRPLVERERPDYDEADDAEIHMLLRELADYDDFLEVPVETLVERVLEMLDLLVPGAAPGAEPAVPGGPGPPGSDPARPLAPHDSA